MDRLIKVYVEKKFTEEIEQFLTKLNVMTLGMVDVAKDITQIEILMGSQNSEYLISHLKKHYGKNDKLKILIVDIEAGIMKEKKVEEKKELKKLMGHKKKPKLFQRISIHELEEEVSKGVELSGYYLSMIVLSVIVAAIGLIKSNPAVIIGSMVIAPLLGPNVGLAFSTTSGKVEMFKKSAQTLIGGLSIALCMSILMGKILYFDPTTHEIASRTSIEFSDIILALCSGAAGVLSLTAGSSSTLVGVMVAVSLMPPLVTSGLLLGSGHYMGALKAFLLLAINIISVNIAGIVTFISQEIKPSTLWESAVIKKNAHKIVFLWSIFIVPILILILLDI